MSHTTVYLANRPNRIRELAELRNSWGFAPPIWNAVSRRVWGEETRWFRLAENAPDQLWGLYKDPRLPLPWRLAFAMTFDKAVLDGGRFLDIARLLGQFHAEAPGPAGHVNHAPAIIRLLEENAGKASVGMMFHATSVNGDSHWRPWDEKRNRNRNYNFAKQQDHFFVLAELEAMEEKR